MIIIRHYKCSCSYHVLSTRPITDLLWSILNRRIGSDTALTLFVALHLNGAEFTPYINNRV